MNNLKIDKENELKYVSTLYGKIYQALNELEEAQIVKIKENFDLEIQRYEG